MATLCLCRVFTTPHLHPSRITTNAPIFVHFWRQNSACASTEPQKAHKPMEMTGKYIADARGRLFCSLLCTYWNHQISFPCTLSTDAAGGNGEKCVVKTAGGKVFHGFLLSWGFRFARGRDTSSYDAMEPGTTTLISGGMARNCWEEFGTLDLVRFTRPPT